MGHTQNSDNYVDKERKIIWEHKSKVFHEALIAMYIYVRLYDMKTVHMS